MEFEFQGGESVAKLVRSSIQDLPALPAILTQILALIEKESVTGADLERIVGADQALAARILRIANSAYYGLERQVASISQASVILGLRQIRNLALSLCAFSMLKTQTQKQREIQGQFWKHALACAIGSQMIANCKRLDAETCDSIYVAGLLHDVGRLFLFTNFADRYEKVYRKARKEQRRLNDVEREELGISHTEVGKELASNWRFPEALVEAISEHEGPFGPSTPPRLYAVNLADALATSAFEEFAFETVADPTAHAWGAFCVEEAETLKAEMLSRVEAFGNALARMAA